MLLVLIYIYLDIYLFISLYLSIDIYISIYAIFEGASYKSVISKLSLHYVTIFVFTT